MKCKVKVEERVTDADLIRLKNWYNNKKVDEKRWKEGMEQFVNEIPDGVYEISCSLQDLKVEVRVYMTTVKKKGVRLNNLKPEEMEKFLVLKIKGGQFAETSKFVQNQMYDSD